MRRVHCLSRAISKPVGNFNKSIYLVWFCLQNRFQSDLFSFFCVERLQYKELRIPWRRNVLSLNQFHNGIATINEFRISRLKYGTVLCSGESIIMPLMNYCFQSCGASIRGLVWFVDATRRFPFGIMRRHFMWAGHAPKVVVIHSPKRLDVIEIFPFLFNSF